MIPFNTEQSESLELEGFEVAGAMARLDSETSKTVIEKETEEIFNLEIFNKEDAVSYSETFNDLDKAVEFFQDNAIV